MFGRGFNSLRLHPLNYFVSWCNGSTTDSGPVCQGSNPCRTTTDQTYTVAGVSRRAKISKRAHSSAGLEHLSYKQRVIGSNPIGPTISSRYIITSSLGEFHSLGWGSFFLFVYLRHCFCAASVLIAPPYSHCYPRLARIGYFVT